jgi:hypothetical protein
MRAGLWGRLRRRAAERSPPPRAEPEPEKVFTPELTEAILQLYPEESQEAMRAILAKGDIQLLLYYGWLMDRYRAGPPTEEEQHAYFLRVGWMTQAEWEEAEKARLQKRIAELQAKLGVAT